MAVVTSESTETISEMTEANDTALLVKKAKIFQEKGEVQAAYEAGCLGYGIQRAFEAAGIRCLVLPANKVAKQREDRIKTDSRDARLIARMLRNGEAQRIAIAVPTEEDEATRDLMRLREDENDALKETKQRLLKFLLRLGYRWEGKNNWTKGHWKWMDSLEFGHEYDREAYEEYRSLIRELESRVKKLNERIKEIAQSEHYRKRVDRLRSFKGVEYLTALAIVCEIGDFRRFGGAKQFMSYLGLVPSESSSGGKQRRGGITKAGNSHLRKLLIESAWHYARNDRAGKAQEERWKDCGAEEIERAKRANRRLHKKYVKLVLSRHKLTTVANTAVARELAGFIWAAATGTEGRRIKTAQELTAKLAEEAVAG